MKISRQARREAKGLFRNCLTKGLLDESRVQRAVQEVAESRPRGYLAVLTQFLRLVRLEIDRRAAKVESAAALVPELQSEVRNRLGRAYGPGLDVAFAENRELIGGLRIRVGSDVYDGSIQARLNELSESF